MKTNRLIIGLLAAMALPWAQAVYAGTGNVTEFGIEGDLTVLGTNAVNAADPDVEIKGFSVFGATQAAPALIIPFSPGNIFVNGYVQVSSGMYVTGGSTFTAGAYFTGISSFSSDANIYVGGGTANQVLKKTAGGAMHWADDLTGLATTGTKYRLQMVDNSGGLTDSMFLQSTLGGAASNITMLYGSSMTIQGDGTDGLGVTGAVKLNGDTSILNASNLTVGTGITSLGGSLNVVGASTFTGVNVNGAAQFGNANHKSTFTATGELYMASGSSITLSGGTVLNLPAPINATDAANKAYVDSQIGSGGPWVRDSAIHAVKLNAISDNVGIGIAIPVAKLQVSSANASAADMLLVVSSGTLAANQVLTVTAAGNVAAIGGTQFGGVDVANTHSINMANSDPNTALSIAGQNVSGDFSAKFYSGATLSAWIKKK